MRDTRGRIAVVALLAAAAVALFVWDPRSRKAPPPPPAAEHARVPDPPAASAAPTWDEQRKAALAAAKPAAGAPVPMAPAEGAPSAAPAEPSPPASVSGSVVNQRGEPVVGAMVTIMPLSGLPNAAPGAADRKGPSGPKFQVAPMPGQNLGVTEGDVPPIPAGDWPNVSGLASSMLVPSGSDGRFHVDSIPGSVVQVVAVMSGYTAARSRPITLVPGAAVTNVELVLHPTP